MGHNPQWKAFDLSWHSGSSKCLSSVYFLANHSAKQCRTPCALRTACGECTSGSSECMWCSNMKQCVDSNAYVASFPFGQCMEWYTMSSCPREWKVSSRQYGWQLLCVGQCCQPLKILGMRPDLTSCSGLSRDCLSEPAYRMKNNDTSKQL